MHILRLAALAIAVLTAIVASAQTDDAIASRFFPDSLVLHDEDPEIRQWNAVRADLSGTGRLDYLVVAYYNGYTNAVRVLHVQNGNTILVDDPQLPPLPLALGTIDLCEIDGDAAQEVFFRVDGDRTSQDFVLDWAGNGLRIVSPFELSEVGHVRTLFSNSYLADLDGDGRAEALVPSLERGGPTYYTSYRFANGEFVPAGEVPFQHRLERTTGAPNELGTNFNVDRPGRYLLRVVNGDPGKTNQATSAKVLINDATVLPESSFKKKERLLTTTVMLTAVSSLRVELRGTPGTALTISLTRVP